MLRRAQREEFETRGLLWLREAVDLACVAHLRDRVLERLSAGNLVPEVTPKGFAVHASRFSPIVRTLDFAKTWGPSVVSLVDELVGAGAWAVPSCAGQVLMVTFPSADAEWTLPHKVWHLDYPAPAAGGQMPGLQVFLCLDRIEPRAGGTLFVAGSHRLVDGLRRRRPRNWPGASADVRQSLASEVPWLRELWSVRHGEDRIARFMGEVTASGGAELQVVETVGEPGDVLAMHPWILHAPAPNCGTRPRLMLTERVRVRPGAD
jgi:hypothetical protein